MTVLKRPSKLTAKKKMKNVGDKLSDYPPNNANLTTNVSKGSTIYPSVKTTTTNVGKNSLIAPTAKRAI